MITKRYLTSTISLIIIGLLLFTSCEKKTNTDKKESEKEIKTKLLADKKWYPVSSTVSPAYPLESGGSTTNYLDVAGNEYLTNYYFYGSDGNGYYDYGDGRDEFIWTFNLDETATIELYDDGFSGTYPIVELTETTWVLTYDISDGEDDYLVTEEYESR